MSTLNNNADSLLRARRCCPSHPKTVLVVAKGPKIPHVGAHFHQVQTAAQESIERT